MIDVRPSRQQVVREGVLFFGLLATGFLVLPLLAWLAGRLLLGAQPDGTGLGSVYGAVFSEAARGKAAAWMFAASPWLLLQSLRLALWPLSRSGGPDGDTGSRSREREGAPENRRR